jgi:hypothetical protein
LVYCRGRLLRSRHSASAWCLRAMRKDEPPDSSLQATVGGRPRRTENARVRPLRLIRSVSPTVSPTWGKAKAEGVMGPREIVCPLLLLASTAACLVGSSKYAQSHSWPQRGLPVFVSRELQPDYTPFEQTNLPPGRTSGPTISRLPACEPVEVQAVAEHKIMVKWLNGESVISSLSENWQDFVHRTKEECMERLNALAGQSVSQ